MNNEELNTALYKKMFAEQEAFRDWLLGQEPTEILNHTYEYTVREDILMALENNDICDEQAAALLKLPAPLSDVFSDFEKRETGYMDIVLDCITVRADEVLRDERERRETMRNMPLYKDSATHALKHDELPLYRASHKANIACRDAIDKAIADNYRDNHLGGDTAKQVIEEFGFDRTLYVLANTVREKDWDGRIERSNKEWAKTIPVIDDSHKQEFVVDKAHPGLVDLFVKQARREYINSQQPSERRPSIREKLQQAALPPKAPVKKKSKGRELQTWPTVIGRYR